MNDILSDLNPSKYKLKSNNNQSGSIQNNTTNEQKGDLLADLNSGKYKLKGSEPKEITQTEVQKGIEQGANPKDAYKGMLANPNLSSTIIAQPQTGEQFLQQLKTKTQMSNERAMPQIQKKFETQRLEEEKTKLEKEINTQKAYMAANDKAYKDLMASGLYSNVAQNSLAQKTNAENKVAELQKQLDQINTKIKVNTIDEETKEYTDTNKDTFFGRAETNFDINVLQQKLAYANNDYLDNPTEENKKIADAYRKAIQEAQENNPNTAGKGGWLDKSLAGYLPQLGNQLKAGGLGGATGAVVAGGLTAAGTALLPTVGEEVLIPKATMWGFNLGSAGSSAADTYKVMRGMAYQGLLDEGIDEETARLAASDEAFVNAAIEFIGNLAGGFILGTGKLAGKGFTTLLSKSGNKVLREAGEKALQKGATEVAKKATVGTIAKNIGKAGVAVGIDALGEGAEEGAQQVVSIANVDRAEQGKTGKLNLVGEAIKKASNLTDEEKAEVSEATKEGIKIGLMTGGGLKAITGVANNAIDSHNAKVKQLELVKPQNQLKGTENLIPQKNVASESATTELQEPAQQTNRIEGQTAQTGNMEQMAKNVEKVSNFSKQSDMAGEKPAFSMPEIPKGHTRLYRGLTQEYNKNYDKSKLDNSNGYESWTDNYELAKAYGDNVYYIDIPTNEIKNDIIDNDSTSETYGDRNLIYFNDKPVGIKGQSGKEYMLYTDHENYPNLEYKSVQTNLNNLENQQEIGYNEIARKPEPKNYVYKRITNSDKARISSDYMVNANKYTEDIGSVDFSDVSYIYQKKNNEIEILKKFKGSQEFINSIKGEWSNGTNEMPERNNKVNESVRDERRQSNIANGGTRRTRESGTSNRPDSRLGGQRGDINGEQVGKNNSDGIKDSEKSSFSLPETDNQGRKLSAEQQEFFKDSKVIDEEGRLKAVYHGTAEDFTIFDEMFAKEGDYGVGFYFSDVKGVAEESAEGKMIDKDIARYASGDKGQVMETYLNMKKPSVWYNYRDIYKYNKMAKEAGLSFYDYMRKNYDGIIVTNPRYENEGFSESKYYIVFNSNQIKNVDNTNPTSNPDIRYFASSESSKPYMDLDRYTSRDNKSKANKVGLTDIQNAINDIVTVKTGKFRQNAYGIYKTHGEIIRLKQMKDIPVALHELTHHLDKMYNLSSSDKAFNELKKIAVVGENATKQTIISEGVAEFGRYYMTDKEYAKEIAPSYYDAFEKALDGDPTMKAKVENIRQMVTNYLDQSPINRLSSNIDYGDEDVSVWRKGKDAIIKTANTFRKNFVDDLDPLKKIVNEISGDKKLMTEEDAYKLLRLNNGVTGKVQVALEYGVLDKKGEKVSKSLKEILEPVANNQKEFVAYLTALRANDLQNRGIESGMLSRDVNDVIKMYKENETFNKAATELYNFQNKILETTLIDSGIITKDALDAYNKNNPHYVPFYRVMDENFKQSKSSKSKKPMKIKGSTRDIINPLESIIKNTYSYMQMAERNDTFKVLFDMANKYDGTGKWFDKVPTDKTMKMSVDELKDILEKLNLNSEEVNYNEVLTSLFKPSNYQKGNIVTVMQKGKPVHYEIMDKELFDILSPTIKGENILVKWLSPASKALRVGATHTPEFVVRNPLRDTVDAAIYSKNKFRPVVDSLIGMFNVAGRTDLYYKWLQSGGSGSTYTNAQRPVLQKTLKGLTEGVTQEKGVKKALKGVGNLVKHPLRTYLDVAGSISNVAEEGTRVGEFRRALQQGKTEKEAALDSREITLDFSRGGKHAKDINKAVAFFNAELQGLDKMLTSFKDRPVATFVKSLAYVALPAIILRALQDEDELEKVPQWEKDEFFVFFVNGTPIKIPKSQGVGQIFGTIPERAIDYLRTHDKDAFDGLVQRLVTSYVPVDSTTSIFPNFFLPLFESATNYSTFKKQPIVNQSLQNRSPKYQYDENTSTIAKTLGELADNIPFVEGGISPKKIDHLISGYFGNLGKDAANLIGMPIDLLSGNKKDNEYKSLNSKLKKVPLLKGFIASDYASKSLDKFYKSKDEVSTKYTDAKFNVSDGGTTATEKAELKYYKELNSLYNKAYNEIKELDEQIDAVTNGKGNDKYKETKIEQLKDKKDSIADKVEKQKELKGFNVKFNK